MYKELRDSDGRPDQEVANEVRGGEGREEGHVTCSDHWSRAQLSDDHLFKLAQECELFFVWVFFSFRLGTTTWVVTSPLLWTCFMDK